MDEIELELHWNWNGWVSDWMDLIEFVAWTTGIRPDHNESAIWVLPWAEYVALFPETTLLATYVEMAHQTHVAPNIEHHAP